MAVFRSGVSYVCKIGFITGMAKKALGDKETLISAGNQGALSTKSMRIHACDHNISESPYTRKANTQASGHALLHGA